MKTVLITGSSSKLGKSLINKYLKEGYNVIGTYHNKLDKIPNVNYFKLDLTDELSIDSLVQELDSIDVLINNAAYNNDCDIFNKTYNEFDKILKTNLIGPFILSTKLKDKFNKNSSIINIASTNGIDTMYPESADYDASKAGLINISKNMASSFKDIRVNVIAPGWIDTDSTIDMDSKLKEKELNKIVMHRFATVEEIANVAYFLSSDDASYINGAVIRVDGGIKYEL